MDIQKTINNCRDMISYLNENLGNSIKVRQIRISEMQTLENAISAMRELQQYRRCGSVEQIKRNLAVAYNIAAVYQIIGTPEEFREAKERQQAKKPHIKEISYRGLSDDDFTRAYSCPRCKEQFILEDSTGFYGGEKNKYCPECGQAIDLRRIGGEEGK